MFLGNLERVPQECCNRFERHSFFKQGNGERIPQHMGMAMREFGQDEHLF